MFLNTKSTADHATDTAAIPPQAGLLLWLPNSLPELLNSCPLCIWIRWLPSLCCMGGHRQEQWEYSTVFYSHELKARSWECSIRADSSYISAVNSIKCLLSVCKIKILQRLKVVGQIWDVFLEVGKRHVTDTNTISCQTSSPSSKAWGC